MALTEYKPGSTFPGVIGRTPDQSKPAWPQPARAKEGAPNVLFIVIDDMGFGNLGAGDDAGTGVEDYEPQMKVVSQSNSGPERSGGFETARLACLVSIASWEHGEWIGFELGVVRPIAGQALRFSISPQWNLKNMEGADKQNSYSGWRCSCPPSRPTCSA